MVILKIGQSSSRAIGDAVNMMCHFYALNVLPLGDVMMIAAVRVNFPHHLKSLDGSIQQNISLLLLKIITIHHQRGLSEHDHQSKSPSDIKMVHKPIGNPSRVKGNSLTRLTHQTPQVIIVNLFSCIFLKEPCGVFEILNIFIVILIFMSCQHEMTMCCIFLIYAMVTLKFG